MNSRIDVDPSFLSMRVTRRSALRGGAAFGLSAGLAGFLAACGDATTTTTASGGSAGRIADQIVVNLADTSPTYNGLDQNIQYLRWVTDQVQECLYGYDDALRIVPVLAESLPEQRDEMSATIRIKPGITFHNGDRLTAEHVAATYNAATEEGRIWAGGLSRLERAVAVDELTTRFTFNTPYTALLLRAVTIPIMHIDYLRESARVMGTGPYQWDRFRQGAQITLRAFEGYRDGPPRTPRIVYDIVPDPGAQIVNLLRGDCDILPMPPYAQVSRLQESDDVTVYDEVAPVNIFFWLSAKTIPDVRVRQAIAYAMDRRRVAEVAFAGYADAGEGPISPATQGYEFAERLFGPDPDYDRARALLKEAGVDRVSFRYISTSEPHQRAMAQVLAEGWAQVGIDAQLVLSDFASWQSTWVRGDWGVSTLFSMDGFASGTAGYVTTNPLRSDNPINFGEFRNRRMDEVLSGVDEAPSEEARARLWGEASTIAQQEAAQVPPVYPRFLAATRRSVDGLPAAQLRVTRLDLKNVTVSD